MKLFRSTSFLACVAFAAMIAFALGCRTPGRESAAAKPQLGIQSWTCRNMTFDQLVEFAKKQGIKNLQVIANHIDPNGTREDWAKKKAVLDANGLVCYTFGVAGTSMDKEKNRKLFEMARFFGCKLIIVEPRNMAEWDNLEQLVKEYDIKLAIHNHGKGTVYGDPETVKGVLAQRDKRIGACIDIGHVSGAGYDVAKIFSEYGADRVFDLHLKDKKIEKADGKDVVLDVDIGTGIANYVGLFATLQRAKWSGVMAIETDNQGFAKEPTEFVAKAKVFFQANVK
jgi:sugar phosphate isomerase/epimerase